MAQKPKTSTKKTSAKKPVVKKVPKLDKEAQERAEAHPMAVPFLWLGNRSVEKNFIFIPLVGLIITSIMGYFYPPKHLAPWDFFFSWSVIGFVAYSFVVLSAEPLFKFLSRKEDYYGEGQVDTGGLEK